MMFLIIIIGLLLGPVATDVLFGLVSFWALREFITMTPTRRGDHRTLFWSFIVFTPLQYVLIGLKAYAIYTIMIPVYASLFVPARIAISGDPKRFLERVAKIQAGLLICVYSLSHAPAILSLVLTESPGG
ncbi:MAG: phosphatidate cytidylyltransferase, partial [Planctomycetia bacterium]|nr:phosphatidate cytidylyltransferase [Planctomycetia bacterium]